MAVPSSRDPEILRQRLAAWLTNKVGAAVSLDTFEAPEGSGFSSETFLFDARWAGDSGPTTQSLVMRMGPVATDTPVFAAYDLSLQVKAMNLVRNNSSVPVPNVRWYEPDPAPLGGEFYIMDRVDGRAARDNPPYVFGGWVTELSADEQRALTHAMADGMAGMHAIDLDTEALRFLSRPQYGTSPLDQQLGYQRWYYDWAREGVDFPIIEQTFAWLLANRPTHDPVALSWGDARIGNLLVDGVRPVAFVDWEMACLGAPATDVAWQLVMHQFFLQILHIMEMDNPCPDLFRVDDFVGRYQQSSGIELQDLEWYAVFGMLRFAIISIRTSERAYRTGESKRPDDPEAAIMNAQILRDTLVGSNPNWSL